jgi:hypothetical protein
MNEQKLTRYNSQWIAENRAPQGPDREPMWMLVKIGTRKEFDYGDSASDRDGKVYVVYDGRPPQHSGSTGRVWVKDATGKTRELFPSVVGLEWIRV